MKGTIDSLVGISNKLETGVLLGRPFFDNFDFIQFIHQDRNREDKCYFNYKVAKGRAIKIMQIDKTAIINQATLGTKSHFV